MPDRQGTRATREVVRERAERPGLSRAGARPAARREGHTDAAELWIRGEGSTHQNTEAPLRRPATGATA